VRPGHGYRIGLAALIQQMLTLALPDPELFGNIVDHGMFRRARIVLGVSIAHGVPA
jgi:hypothetical protein